MGSFGITRRMLREELADLVGVRVGLALGIGQLDPLIDSHLPDIGPDSDDGRRVKAHEFSDLTHATLARFGDPWASLGPTPLVTAYFDLPEPNREFVAQAVLDEIHRQVHIDQAGTIDHGEQACGPSLGPVYAVFDMFVHTAALERIDEDELLSRVAASLGEQGRDACTRLLFAVRARQRIDPYLRVIRAQTSSIAALSDLFDGRDNQPGGGEFFDQRYINYLAANLDEIPQIHWRQFERLTAEYFHRKGYVVELGPGSNDDGVDLRLWPDESSRSRPPLMIIQCKRQRTKKVPKTIVKALWADMVAERAQRGVIVTTTSIEPGAQKTIDVRRYDIDVADQTAVGRWLRELRTPGSGISAM